MLGNMMSIVALHIMDRLLINITSQRDGSRNVVASPNNGELFFTFITNRLVLHLCSSPQTLSKLEIDEKSAWYIPHNATRIIDENTMAYIYDLITFSRLRICKTSNIGCTLVGN